MQHLLFIWFLCLAAVSGFSGGSIRPVSKSPILIFPAQFGTEADYEGMKAELEARGHPTFSLPLARFDWLKITRSVFTSDYWKGTLQPRESLGFYFEAAEKALSDIKEQYPNRKVHVVGHSIGGWIARAYLGEVCDSGDVQDRIVSLTTLGTPHLPPDGDGPFTAFEQTRGLLSYVNENFPGNFHKNIKYTCVCGTSTEGKLGTDIESSVAYVSYLPLCGKGETVGDGIVPAEIAFLEGARSIRLPNAKHAGFIPTAGPSIKLPSDFLWYGSPSLIDEWASTLPEY